MKGKVVVLLGAALVTLWSLTSQGQITTGTISGTVKDASGAVLPGATVVAQSEETGFSRTVSTDSTGRYIAPSLDPGLYKITASMDGFQTTSRTGIELTLGRQVVINFDLTVGSIATSVEVTAEAPLVDTIGGTLGGTIESSKITELPLNGRDLAQLITLQAGVVNFTEGSSDGGGRVLVVSGARATQNVFYMDGVSIESFAQKTPTGVSGNFLGSDSVREFKVDSNAYSAEYGRGSGGIFNIATKSGTNNFHGSVFEYLRNDNLDAAQWEDNRFGGEKPEFKRNQFGFSVGGPILRDKTFFFGNYEGFRERQGETGVSRTFSDALRRGQIASVGAPDARIVPYLQFWPQPNTPVTAANPDANGVQDYVFLRSVPTNENYIQGRVDHQFTENDLIYGRYTFSDSDRLTPDSFPTEGGASETQRNQLMTIEEKHIFTPTLLNSLRLGFTRTRPDNHPADPPEVPAELRFIPFLPFLGNLSPGSTLSSIGHGQSRDSRTINSFQVSDDMVLTKGPHTFKWGFMGNRIYFNGFQAARDAGSYEFANVASFYAVNVRRFRGTISACCLDGARSLQQSIIGLYFQDEWRVTPRLTVTPGIRYEFITVPAEKYGRLANIIGDYSFMMSAGLRDIRTGNDWMKNPSLKNFAPRLGFAWDVMGDGRMALRGGFGLFFTPVDQTWLRTGAWRMPPFYIEQEGSGTGVPFPGIYALCSQADLTNPSTVPPACSNTKPAPQYTPYEFGNPYTMQYNLNVQKQLTGSTVVTVGYAGSRGIRLPGVADTNVPLAQDINGRLVFPGTTAAFRPNQNFDVMRYRSPMANSWYNALQITATQRMTRGMQFSAAYTFAKMIDEVSGLQTASDVDTGTNEAIYQNIKLTKGLSAFDSRNVFTLSGIYDLPIGGGSTSGMAAKALRGWQLSGILTLRDGFPGTIEQSNRLSAIGIRQELPDLNSGFSNNPISGTSSGCTLGIGANARVIAPGTPLGTPDLYYDVCAFVQSPARTLGTLGRNTLTLPGFVSLDFTIGKDTELTEAASLQFRFEAYNLLNRVNFGSPARSVFETSGQPTTTAGRITDSKRARQLQFGLKLVF
jgi:hypothetical protein